MCATKDEGREKASKKTNQKYALPIIILDNTFELSGCVIFITQKNIIESGALYTSEMQ
jgi:hypothetical protein